MIRVVVVEDSPVVRDLMVNLLSSDPTLQVVGTARDGEEALEAVERLKPDIVTMDIHMPRLNGLEAARRIMETNPTPIVVVSGSYDPEVVNTTFRALEAGALAVVAKPAGEGHPRYAETSADLLRTVKAMAEVKVIRRWARPSRLPLSPPMPPMPEVEAQAGPVDIKVIAIGASTGGPLALQTVLSNLPDGFQVPILIVQHIAAGFICGFAEWLGRSSKIPVSIAVHGEQILAGRAYIAPDGLQMTMDVGGKISLRKSETENGLCPSVASLFRSVANSCGQQAVGVLLTGMGKDGAEELRLMKEKGSLTIAQDEASCVVYGMPGEAIRLGAASYVLSPARIAAALAALTQTREMTR